MSETDAVTLAQSLYANAQGSYAILLSLLSGYLVIAYFMGKNLSKGQLVIVNLLYVTSVAFTLFIYRAFGNTALYYTRIAVEARGGAHDYQIEYAPELALFLNVILAFAALVFMWMVRHQEKE